MDKELQGKMQMDWWEHPTHITVEEFLTIVTYTNEMQNKYLDVKM